MTRDEIIKRVDAIDQIVTLATSFLSVYESIGNASVNRLTELNYAPGFFGLVSKALLQGIFLETTKLFSPKEDYSIKKFLNMSEQYLPKIHVMKPDIEEIECGDVNLAFGFKMDTNSLFIKEKIKNWQMEHDGFCKKVKNLREQRDKYYAHCDKKYMDNLETLFADFPISFNELRDLLTFASSVCNGVRVYLTGVDLDHRLSNSGDLSGLLDALYQDH